MIQHTKRAMREARTFGLEAQVAALRQENDGLLAEIERLKKERDYWEREAHNHAYDDIDEIDRLRAACRFAVDVLDANDELSAEADGIKLRRLCATALNEQSPSATEGK